MKRFYRIGLSNTYKALAKIKQSTIWIKSSFCLTQYRVKNEPENTRLKSD